MEQYERSAPPATVTEKQNQDLAGAVDNLQRRVAQQDALIEDLQRQVRRLKEKMDRHADYLNRQQRG